MTGWRTLFYKEVLRFCKVAARVTGRGAPAGGSTARRVRPATVFDARELA
jgi:hypothetical protein